MGSQLPGMRYSRGITGVILSWKNSWAFCRTSSEKPVPILQMVSYSSISLLQAASRYDPQSPFRLPAPKSAPIGTKSKVSPKPSMQSFLSFTHSQERREQVQGESRSLIMSPSVPNLMAELRNSSIFQKSSTSVCSLMRRMSEERMGCSLARYSLRSMSGRWVIGSLKQRMSKAKRLTWTSISLMVVALRERVESTWKDINCLVFLLMATISQSMMKLLSSFSLPSMFFRMFSTKSTYASVMFSRFREKIWIEPSLQCTCPRNPSYLNSEVSLLPSNLLRISPIPLVGLASIGLQGMPSVSLQESLRYSKFSLRSTSVRMIFSSLGYSALAFLMASQYASKLSSCCWLRGKSSSNNAWMSAFCMVFSPAEIFRLPSIQRMMNFASSLVASRRRLMRIFSFSACELLPLVLLMRMKLLKTFSMDRGTFSLFLVKKESMVFWEAFEFWATSPRSPNLLTCSRTCFSDMPQLRATDFTRISFPMKSSFFSYSGPHLMMESQQPRTRSSVDFRMSSLNMADRWFFWMFLELSPLVCPTISYTCVSRLKGSLVSLPTLEWFSFCEDDYIWREIIQISITPAVIQTAYASHSKMNLSVRIVHALRGKREAQMDIIIYYRMTTQQEYHQYECSHVLNIYQKSAEKHPEKGNLYLCGVDALDNADLIKDLKIDCVISIIDKLTHNTFRIKEKLRKYKIKHSKWIDLEDFDSANIFPHLDSAQGYIKDMLPEHNILLHVQADMSRSSSLIIAALMKQYGEDYHHANIYAKTKRHIVEPAGGFDKKLRKYEVYLRRNHPHYFKRKM